MIINFIEYFENGPLRNCPDRFAVIEGEKQISFIDLAKRAKRLANCIIEKLNVIRTPIAVFLPKGVDAVIANLAISYSGNAYMNMDIKNPDKRLESVIQLIDPKIIITNYEFSKRINLFANGVLVIIINDSEKYSSTFDLSRLNDIIDTDLYCIINTSGSTGVPKGVALNQRSFIDFYERSVEIFNFQDHEIIGSLSPLVFDIYSFELCMLMAKGSTLLVIPDYFTAFPVRIIELLRFQQVSFIFWVPTIMVNISNMGLLNNVKLPNLKMIWFAGEVFPTKQFNYWRKNLSNSLFANLYGPIEITLDCTYFVVNREIPDDEPLPIGRPYKNTEILILDEKNQKITLSEEGELCIRGSSLAMGYYNNPEKTALAFVQNPLNSAYPELIYRTGDIVSYNQFGEIVFKGRKDSLIKHLGYRIELGEIEHVIVNILKLAKNGCIVYKHDKKEIALFYESEAEISTAEFRKKLISFLPKYMIPNLYIRMQNLPRNNNGKIDRLFLKTLINS